MKILKNIKNSGRGKLNLKTYLQCEKQNVFFIPMTIDKFKWPKWHLFTSTININCRIAKVGDLNFIGMDKVKRNMSPVY